MERPLLNKLLIVLFVFSIFPSLTTALYFNSSNIVPASECYQEYANVTSACGGLDTGLYYPSASCPYFDGENWENVSFTDLYKAYDGDWTNFVTGSLVCNLSLFVNYTVPAGFDSSKIQVGSINTSTATILNFTIPSDCLRTQLDLRINISNSGIIDQVDHQKYYCHNGTGYEFFANINKSKYGINNPQTFVEEAMIWISSGSGEITYLNSTVSNSSMSFQGLNISVDEVIIDSMNITLINVNYTRGSLGINNMKVFWNTPNSNLDSTNYPWMNYSTSTIKTIITNVTVKGDLSFPVDSCNTISRIFYTPNGDGENSLKRNEFSCVDGIAKIYQVDVNLGVNTVEIKYECSDVTSAGYQILIILAALVLPIFCLFYIRENGISLGAIIIMFVGIIFGVVMWLGAGQNLASSCPVG